MTITQGYYITPAKLKRVKAAAKFAGHSVTWQSIAARPEKVDEFLAKIEPAMEKAKERKKNQKHLRKNPRKKIMKRKKKRSAKQLANDKRLGAMAKARHAKKRGKKKASKKKRKVRSRVAKSTTARTTRRRINPATFRKSKQATKRTPKLVIYNVFKCYGKSVRFLGLTTAGKLHWTIRDAAMSWKKQKSARSIALKVASQRGMSKYNIGVASYVRSTAQIAAHCKRGKV